MTLVASPGRSVVLPVAFSGSRRRRLCCPVAVSRRMGKIDHGKVDDARRRLRAGEYDRVEILARTLEIVLANFSR